MPQIKSYRSSKTEIKYNSKIHGNGLYAKEDIMKGEIIFIKNGHIVPIKRLQKIEDELGDYSLQITDNFCLTPITKDEVRNLAIYINHSCNPNVGPDGQITFIALRNIKAGEELCYDYAMTTSYEYRLVCNCGSKICRKIITGDDWKLKELRERYGDHFSYHILKKIESLN